VRDEQSESGGLLAEKNTGTTPKPTKSTRRSKHGGLREIERKILKENTN